MSDTIEYNGYLFPSTSNVKISSQMDYDDAQRTVVYNRHKITVEAIIAPYECGNGTAGTHNWDLHKRLSKAGQVLKVRHDGFGPELLVNYATGGERDVAFGPKPTVISWDPVGHTGAVEVVWECEVCIPVCDNAKYRGLAAFNYAVRYSISEKGYTQRSISGYLEIAMTRTGRGIPDSADQYRDIVEVAKPDNFSRTSEWQLSADKRRADFSINDSEIESPNAYPEGVVAIDANHRASARASGESLGKIQNSISCRIELAAGQPRGRAWMIFRSIVMRRATVVSGGVSVFWEELTVNESLFGNSIDFEIQYKILSEVGRIFDVTNLFQSLPFSWQYWARSMQTIQSHRGIAELEHLPTDDTIIDLCADGSQTTQGAGNQPRPGYSYPQKLCNAKPSPRFSWLRFEGNLQSIEDHESAMQMTVGGDDLLRKDFDPTDPAATNGESVAEENIQRIIEEGSANLILEWSGYAERAGYPIPRPDKLKIGDVTLVKVGRTKFIQQLKGNMFCVPVYKAAWKVRYAVEERPPEVDPQEGDPVNDGGTT